MCQGDVYLFHRFKHGLISRITVAALLGFLVAFVIFIFSRSVPRIFAKRQYNHKADKQMTVDYRLDSSSFQYAIVVDCGSSGSRVFVYYWPPHDGIPDNLLHIKPVKDGNGNLAIMKIEPGISSFVLNPSAASESLSPLLDYAAQQVPAEKRPETPLYIMATAGMRLLSDSDQDAILSDLRVDIPLRYPFLFASTHVEVIAGKQEAIYAWVAVNYVLGKFNHAESDQTTVEIAGTADDIHLRKRTVGMLDMGGASLQVAYEVTKTEDVAQSSLTEFNLGCSTSNTNHVYRVYVATYLGFGGNSAISRYQERLLLNATQLLNINDSISPTTLMKSRLLLDPCLPVDMVDKVKVKQSVVSFKGTGNYLHCKQILLSLVNHTTPCLKPPCSMNGVFQPEINFENSEYYGFSEFYYSMEDVLRMAGPYDYSKFEHAASEYCGTTWSTLERWYKENLFPFADKHRFKYQCIKSAWLTTVLHSGLGFPKDYKSLTSAQLIKGSEVQWTLGALLYKTRYYPLREIEKQTLSRPYRPSWIKEVSQAQYLFICCFVVVLTAILIYIRRLRIVTPAMRRVPTMSYFMTDVDQLEEGLITDKYSLPTS